MPVLEAIWRALVVDAIRWLFGRRRRPLGAPVSAEDEDLPALAPAALFGAIVQSDVVAPNSPRPSRLKDAVFRSGVIGRAVDALKRAGLIEYRPASQTERQDLTRISCVESELERIRSHVATAANAAESLRFEEPISPVFLTGDHVEAGARINASRENARVGEAVTHSLEVIVGGDESLAAPLHDERQLLTITAGNAREFARDAFAAGMRYASDGAQVYFSGPSLRVDPAREMVHSLPFGDARLPSVVFGNAQEDFAFRSSVVTIELLGAVARAAWKDGQLGFRLAAQEALPGQRLTLQSIPQELAAVVESAARLYRIDAIIDLALARGLSTKEALRAHVTATEEAFRGWLREVSYAASDLGVEFESVPPTIWLEEPTE